MMLDSSNEDKREREPDNTSPDGLIRKELVIYNNKR